MRRLSYVITSSLHAARRDAERSGVRRGRGRAVATSRVEGLESEIAGSGRAGIGKARPCRGAPAPWASGSRETRVQVAGWDPPQR